MNSDDGRDYPAVLQYSAVYNSAIVTHYGSRVANFRPSATTARRPDRQLPNATVIHASFSGPSPPPALLDPAANSLNAAAIANPVRQDN